MTIREEHPDALFLKFDAMPSVWCSGCGIGIVVNTFIQSLKKNSLPLEKIRLISSGLGCTGKISGYVKLNSIHAQGKDPFLTALNSREIMPDTKTIIFIQDSDIMVHGLEGMVKACHSGRNVIVVYFNSFIFHVFSLQKRCRNLSKPEVLFNLPAFANRSGAAVIARWTPLHCRRLISSLRAALLKPGFSFLEIVSPCLMYYAGAENPSENLDRMKLFLNNACINHQAAWEELELRDLNEFYVGHFSEKK